MLRQQPTGTVDVTNQIDAPAFRGARRAWLDAWRRHWKSRWTSRRSRMSSSGTDTARCCSSVSTGAPSASKNRPPISPTAPSEMSSSSILVSRKLPSKSVVDGGHGADAEQHHVGTPARLQSARDQRIATHGRHRGRIGVQRRGQSDRGRPQHICTAAEDELGAGLIRGARHGTVQLDHRAATRHSRRHGGGDRDLFGAPGESEDIVGCQAAHQQCRRCAPHAGERRWPSGCPDVDAMPGDHRFGQAEALLEFALLLGVQIVAHVRGDDDLNADESPGLGPRDQPSGCRPGHPEPNRDLGLGEPIEVVQRRRAQGQP